MSAHEPLEPNSNTDPSNTNPSNTDQEIPATTKQLTTKEPPTNGLVRFSVRNFVFSIGIFVMVVLLGLVSTARLGVELLPNFEIPVLAVSTSYPGASPEQVDREVSRKLEDAVSSVVGIVDINTTSVSNQSAVVLTFADGTDIDAAANSVSQSVAAIRSTLPKDTEAPVIQKFDPNATPIITLALFGGDANPTKVSAYAEDVLIPRLQRVKGVADVTLSGDPTREVQVLLDPTRLQTYDVSPSQVSQAISNSALDLPAGKISQQGSDTLLSTRNMPKTAQDVSNILINNSAGLQVLDVASVRDSSIAPKSYARVNGQPAILLDIRKSSGSNSVAVADGVRNSLESMNLPDNYRVTLATDTTESTRSSVEDTFKEFIIAVIAVSIICLLFLGRLNTVMAVVLAIPISISAAPLLFGALGFTFNIISLLAIIVAIGIVVDDSIVVAENVQRYRDLGYSPMKSVLFGGSEVFSAITASSFALLAVLIPLSFMPGILGQFFSQFGLGIAAAIVLSWLESLLFLTVRMAYAEDPEPLTWQTFPTLTAKIPQLLLSGFKEAWRSFGGWIGLVLAAISAFFALNFALQALGMAAFWQGIISVLLAPAIFGVVRTVFTLSYGFLEAFTGTLHSATMGVVGKVARFYARTLDLALQRSWIVWTVLGIFLLSTPIALRNVGFSFTPKSDSGLARINLTLPVGSELSMTNQMVREIEELLLPRKEIELLEANVGSVTGDMGTSTSASSNRAQLNITLVDKHKREDIDSLVERYSKLIDPIVNKVSGTEVRVFSEQGGPGGNADISLSLNAPNQALLRERNAQLMKWLAEDENFRTLDSSLNDTRQERTFVPDPAKLAGTGLGVSDIAGALRTYNNGSNVGTLQDGDRSVDIVVKLDPVLIKDEQSLLAQTVYSPILQANVPLSQLGEFRQIQAPATLSRFNKAYTATIDMNVVKGGPNPFAYQTEIIDAARAKGIVGNDGVTLGNASAFGNAGLTSDLVFYGPIVMIAATLLTYLVLGSQFNSFRYPIYLLIPVPLAVVGGLWSLSFFGADLDVITVLGMVILLGLSTKNSILYLEFVTERIRILSLRQALIEAAELRFRPIIMTTLTVLVISIPLVLGEGDGAEFRRGLGIVILGGVLTSTLLTFYVVPSVFWFFERHRAEYRGPAEQTGGTGGQTGQSGQSEVQEPSSSSNTPSGSGQFTG